MLFFRPLLLVISLGSISSRRNLIPPGWAEVFAVVGILLLSLAGARTVSVKRNSRAFLRVIQEAEQQATLGATPSSKPGDADGEQAGSEADA